MLGGTELSGQFLEREREKIKAIYDSGVDMSSNFFTGLPFPLYTLKCPSFGGQQKNVLFFKCEP